MFRMFRLLRKLSHEGELRSTDQMHVVQAWIRGTLFKLFRLLRLLPKLFHEAAKRHVAF
jgi:hypothetical protein